MCPERSVLGGVYSLVEARDRQESPQGGSSKGALLTSHLVRAFSAGMSVAVQVDGLGHPPPGGHLVLGPLISNSPHLPHAPLKRCQKSAWRSVRRGGSARVTGGRWRLAGCRRAQLGGRAGAPLLRWRCGGSMWCCGRWGPVGRSAPDGRKSIAWALKRRPCARTPEGAASGAPLVRAPGRAVCRSKCGRSQVGGRLGTQL